MGDDDVASTPIAEFVVGLTEALDDALETQPQGFAMVERMRISMPVEFYVRSDIDSDHGVATIESRPASRMLTSFMPVLHGFWLVAEVDRDEQRESGLEP
jgi:hypothetical protein